jgi:ADP-heptose:LPS heptosyltransferase
MLPLKSIVIGSRDDMRIAEEVVEFSRGRAISLAGMTTLRELIEIMREAILVVSNDSGPMHIASGFGVPVVALFGPTSPLRTGPYGSGHCIIRSEMSCSPCFQKMCGDVKCMREITVETVCEKVSDTLSLR